MFVEARHVMPVQGGKWDLVYVQAADPFASHWPHLFGLPLKVTLPLKAEPSASQLRRWSRTRTHVQLSTFMPLFPAA